VIASPAKAAFPPFEKGGQGGFAFAFAFGQKQKKIPLGPPFSKGKTA
jgi:hypothetical protein